MPMKPYTDLSGKSGIEAYESGPEFLRVKYRGGEIYQYNAIEASDELKLKVQEMQRLAERGEALATFINRNRKVLGGITEKEF